MTAFDSARYHDLLEAQSRGPLNRKDSDLLERLERAAMAEEERQPRPRWLGGDYPDL